MVVGRGETNAQAEGGQSKLEDISGRVVVRRSQQRNGGCAVRLLFARHEGLTGVHALRVGQLRGTPTESLGIRCDGSSSGRGQLSQLVSAAPVGFQSHSGL